MKKWDGYRYVIALARCGSMTAAAKSLDTNTATVSRHIHRMTEIYGTVLFVKNKARWELTKEGEALVRVIETFEKGLHDLDRNNGFELTSGRVVKISTHEFLVSTYLMSGLGSFTGENPGLSLEFVCGDGRVNLAQGEADVSITMARPHEGRSICSKIAQVELAPYRVKGSAQSGWIGLGEDLDWTPEMRVARDLFRRDPQIRVQSYAAARQGAIATGLSTVLPIHLVKDDDELEQVETDCPPILRDIWVTYHETRKMDPVVRLTAEWVQKCFAEPETGRIRSVA